MIEALKVLITTQESKLCYQGIQARNEDFCSEAVSNVLFFFLISCVRRFQQLNTIWCDAGATLCIRFEMVYQIDVWRQIRFSCSIWLAEIKSFLAGLGWSMCCYLFPLISIRMLNNKRKSFAVVCLRPCPINFETAQFIISSLIDS